MMSNQLNNKRVWAVAATVAIGTAAGAAHGQTTAPAAERFVANAGPAGGTLTLRPRAVVTGADVRLRDVCRWADGDAAAFAPLADLTVSRLGDGGSTVELPVETLRATLREAGVNLAAVRLGGAGTCVVTRDITAAAAEPTTAAAAATAAATDPPLTAAEAECNPFHTLRDRLLADAAQRLNVAAADLQLTFVERDASLLNLSEPTFHFQLDPKQVQQLGRVSWDVTVQSGSATQRAVVTADARAWQNQLVLTRPAAYHQVLRAGDVSERRVLLDRLGDDAPLARSQAIGQPVARELKGGAVLTARLLDPLPLVRPGQYVTVTLNHGSVQVRTVVRALEGGTFGQSIKVRNDATRDEYQVTLTGPQVATLGPTPGDANLASDGD